ncbi:MAG TPA: translocation/assembly module TamB domain-containing protein [Elusimicrobiota bacterium]|nr:translocation/assembly module TamB domain-containing protein [Elusimicrobiota bacterium]
MLWQPDDLKKKLLLKLAEPLHKAGYQLAVDQISGNMVWGFTVRGLRISAHDQRDPILVVDRISIKPDWLALFHGAVRIDRIDVSRPRLIWNLSAARSNPATPAAAPKEPFSLVELGQGRLSDGIVTVKDARLPGHARIEVTDINLELHGSGRQWCLDRGTAALGRGRISGFGNAVMGAELEIHASLEVQGVELEQLITLEHRIPGPLCLRHSGHWVYRQVGPDRRLRIQGKLAEAPINLTLELDGGTYKTAGRWDRVSLERVWRIPAFHWATLSGQWDLSGMGARLNGAGELRAVVRAPHGKEAVLADGRLTSIDGRPRFRIVAGTDAFRVSAQGAADLPRGAIRSDFQLAVSSPAFLGDWIPSLAWNQGQLQMSGTLSNDRTGLIVASRGIVQDIRWKDKTISRGEWIIDSRRDGLQAEVSVSGMRTQDGQDKPFDIMEGHLSAAGHRPKWASSVSLRFRNGSDVSMHGSIANGLGWWRLAWENIALHFPSLATWTSRQPGSITWWASRRIELRDLLLRNGAQSVRCERLVWSPATTDVRASVQRLEVAPWVALMSSAVSLKGAVDAAWDMQETQGRARHQGFIRGTFPELNIESLGLHIQDVLVDIEGRAGLVEIKQFGARMKKGDIALSGNSERSRLQYTFKGHHVVVKTATGFTGDVDLELALAGTTSAPDLRGKLTLHQATYTAPAKQKSKKPSPLSSPIASGASGPAMWQRATMDVAVQWPRNVWYRDGLSSIETRGDMRLKKFRGPGPTTLTGNIDALRGTYNYFGHDFNIDSADIQFAGTPEINPNLNIQASYHGDPAVVVYLNVTGTFQNPKLKLSSNPPLSEQDIVSVIAFGQPLSELRSRTGGGNANQEMLQAAGNVLGSYVSKKLRQTGLSHLNLDVVNVQPTETGTEVTVGRYLGPRLFVSYGQTLRGAAEKSISADYFLSDKWTLEGESDSIQGNDLDFLFRYPLNGRGLASSGNPAILNSPFRPSLDLPVNPAVPR